MENALLSIVLIARNDTSSMLRRALNSVINQTYENKEIIVVDSNEWESAASFSVQEDMSDFPGVIYDQPPQFASDASPRNRALNLIHGEYVVFLSASEVWESSKAELQIHQINSARHVAASCADGAIMIEEKKTKAVTTCLGEISYKSLDWLLNSPFRLDGQVVYRTGALQSIGGFTRHMNQLCNLDAMIRLRESYKVLFLPIVLEQASVRITWETYMREYSDRKRLLNNTLYTDMLLVNGAAFLQFNLRTAHAARKAGQTLNSLLLMAVAFLHTPFHAIAAAFKTGCRFAAKVIRVLRCELEYHGLMLKARRAARTGNIKPMAATTLKPILAAQLKPVKGQPAATAERAFLYMGDMSVSEIEIPGHVTRLGKAAFAGCKNLVSVTVPDSVQEIDDGAFIGCVSLREVHFGAEGRLASIGDCAFAGCAALERLRLPGTLRKLGKYAFACCESLSEVGFYTLSRSIVTAPNAFPKAITDILPYTFAQCGSLVSVRFSGGSMLRRIGESAFLNCTKLRTVWIDARLMEIDKNAFRNCEALDNAVLLNNPGMNKIGARAFMNCAKLEQFVLPTAMPVVESDAFSGCKALQSIRLHRAVGLVKRGAFARCYSMTEAYADNPNIRISRGAFERNTEVIRNTSELTISD